MSRKKILTLAAAFALVFVVAVGGAGAASYQDVSSGNLPLNETFSVSNSTESVNVMVENITVPSGSTDSTGSYDVTVTGIDNGTETEVATGTVTTDQTADTFTDSYSYESLDPETYDSYEVEVDGLTDAEAVEIYALERSGDGGGAISDGDGFDLSGFGPTAIAVGAVLALLAAAAWKLE